MGRKPSLKENDQIRPEPTPAPPLKRMCDSPENCPYLRKRREADAEEVERLGVEIKETLSSFFADCRQRLSVEP